MTLPSGHGVPLNADRTVTVLAGPATGATTFTYRIATGQGNGTSSVGTVPLTVIPGFVAGTRIAVPGGERPVETLRPGDLVLTRDHGPQPARRTGARHVAALGPLARPVLRRAETLALRPAQTAAREVAREAATCPPPCAAARRVAGSAVAARPPTPAHAAVAPPAG